MDTLNSSGLTSTSPAKSAAVYCLAPSLLTSLVGVLTGATECVFKDAAKAPQPARSPKTKKCDIIFLIFFIFKPPYKYKNIIRRRAIYSQIKIDFKGTKLLQWLFHFKIDWIAM